MSLKTILTDVVRAVVEEAERNPDFARRIEQALGLAEKPRKQAPIRALTRRSRALVDPVELARQGETTLRAQLAALTLEQLKDVVADYGMDPGKLVMKWKVPGRIIDRIVEMSVGRATKGEGFLSSGTARPP